MISIGVQEKDIYFADVAAGRASDYTAAFQGADAVIIATSGVPKIVPWSLIGVSYVYIKFVIMMIYILISAYNFLPLFHS